MNDYFKIAIGQPQEVEQQVNQLIEQGWQLHGYTMIYTPVNTSHHVIMQPMRYDNNE